MAIRSQADQRKFAKYTDQHNRKWEAWVEIRTGDPCSILTPVFKAPIIPPPMYLKMDKETPGRIEIQYDQWVRDLIAADTDWVRRCHETGVELYKDAFNPESPFNVAILNRIGARPHIPRAVTPLRELPIPGAAALPVQACQAGLLWALGFKGPNGEEPKMPERLREFFVPRVAAVPVFENEFLDAAPAPTVKAARPVVPSLPNPFQPEDTEELPPFLKSATASRHP